MIRSRDLVLFVVTIFFLLMGINVTLWLDRDTAPSSQSVTFVPRADTYEVTASEQAVIDRPAIIASLREQIAASTETVTPQPSVTGDADRFEEALASSSLPVKSTYAQYCLYPDDVLPYITRWPLEGADVSVVGSERLVYTEVVTTVSASSTKKDLVRDELIALATNPALIGGEYCLPSEVVGVTTSGFLLFNDDVSFYRAFNENQLIGYARDGFPIYGTYSGEVDVCGGYDHPAGYRYSVRPETSFLLGCYQAPPASFTF